MRHTFTQNLPRFPLAALPAQVLHHGGNPPLFGCAEVWSFDIERMTGHLAHGCLARFEIVTAIFFPGVRFIAGRLFGHDVVTFEGMFRPPLQSGR